MMQPRNEAVVLITRDIYVKLPGYVVAKTFCGDKGPGTLVIGSCGYQGPMEVAQHCHGYKSGAPGL